MLCNLHPAAFASKAGDGFDHNSCSKALKTDYIILNIWLFKFSKLQFFSHIVSSNQAELLPLGHNFRNASIKNHLRIWYVWCAIPILFPANDYYLKGCVY